MGWNLKTKKWCAVKIMKNEYSGNTLKNFMEEVRVLFNIKDLPGMISLECASVAGSLVKSSGKVLTVVYHATNHAKYGEFYKILKKMGPFAENIARTYLFQLIQGITVIIEVGLEQLHAKKIAHRDIKTENILLDSDLNLIIADFGSAAKCKDEDGGALLFDSSIPVGSLQCNAPEISAHEKYLGEKADIFSAGVCAFFLVMGCPPFFSAERTDPYFRRFKMENRKAFWDIFKSSNCSLEFRDLFEKMCEPNPSKRISLSAISLHPWFQGEKISIEKISGLIQDKLEGFIEARYKKMATKKKKAKLGTREYLEGTITINFMELEKECKDINAFIEKKN